MTDERTHLFNARKPEVSEQDMVEAARSDKVVVSFGALPVIAHPPFVQGLALKFAMNDGSVSTMIIDRYACEVLRLLIDRMNQGEWHATVTSPPGGKPN